MNSRLIFLQVRPGRPHCAQRFWACSTRPTLQTGLFFHREQCGRSGPRRVVRPVPVHAADELRPRCNLLLMRAVGNWRGVPKVSASAGVAVPRVRASTCEERLPEQI